VEHDFFHAFYVFMQQLIKEGKFWLEFYASEKGVESL
jgi:hypothetical protein